MNRGNKKDKPTDKKIQADYFYAAGAQSPV